MDNLNVFKCKCCGAPLDVRGAQEGVLRCPYCQTPWTVPKSEISPAALQFLRMAEHDLDTCKFNDAFTAYKKAAELDEKEPEAYFGMALAEFKVQYLKDHVNNRLQPICHETTEKKFTDSASFLKALRFATNEQRAEYEKKGAEIDYILGEFYRLKESKLDYDCFICVKVTDDSTKQPTEDSKDADYIYRLLQDKGYKPFYSERELRNVTGADYEARILYALYMSECMLVVCRNEAYLQTPWVKNEYTRFLKLVNDEEKESDSVTIVFNGTPIERLPGRNGKLQGINFALRESDGKILDFVEKHTPEAKAKREAESQSRNAQAEEIRRQIEEQKRAQQALEERLRAMQSGGGDAQNGALLEELRLAREAREREKLSKDFSIAAGVLKKYSGLSKTVVIPDGVTSIDSKAFSECAAGLTEIIIPNSVTSIGNSAFKGCSGLTSITIPNSVTSIGDFAFEGCSGLTSITIPDSVTSIGGYAFDGCSGLTGITIPDSVTSIGNGAFKGCSGLTSITIPNSVTSIGDFAFEVCSGLTSITIPDSVTSIGNYAFEGCSGLKNIMIPNSVVSIGKSLFSNCTSLEEITIPMNGISCIHTERSSLKNIKRIVLTIGKSSASVKAIDAYAFYDCSKLTSITIPNDVVSIGKSAFCKCISLTSITIPNGVTRIGEWTFSGCSRLTSITIPNSVILIETYAFNECSGLTSITISKGVVSIGESAFSDCSRLTSITIPNSVTSIGDGAFAGCSGLKSVTMPRRFKKNLEKIFSHERKHIHFTFT